MASMMKWIPGCPCCCPNHECLYWEYNADGYYFNDLSQVSGWWQDKVNTFPGGLNPPFDLQVITTEDDDAVLVTGEIDVNNKVDLIYQRESGTSVWRAIVGWKDENNYAYAEFTCSNPLSYLMTASFRLGEVIGGVDSYLTSSSSATTDGGCTLGYGPIGISISVCLNDGYVTCRNQRVAVSDPSALGKRVGIKTISSTGGRYDFCDLVAWYQYEDCISCRCPSCQADKTVSSVLIDPDGVAAGPDCSDVDYFNDGSFAADLLSSTATCTLRIEPSSRPCDLTLVRISASMSCTDLGEKNGTFDLTVTIRLERDPMSGKQVQTVTFSRSVESCCPSDCETLLSTKMVLEFVSTVGDAIYDFSGATVSVVAA